MSSFLGAYGIRNALNKFFYETGHGELTGWSWNPPVDTYSPLAKFIHTRGVNEWEKAYLSDHRYAPKFDAETVLNMTLSGCIFRESVCDEMKARGWGVPSDFFDAVFYKELCKVANDHDRAMMKLAIQPYFYKNSMRLDYPKTVDGKVCIYKGDDKDGKEIWEPVNP